MTNINVCCALGIFLSFGVGCAEHRAAEEVSHEEVSHTVQMSWIAMLAPKCSERGSSVSVDASGNVYVAGLGDDLSGEPNNGDGFIRKYDSTGVEQWTLQGGIGSIQLMSADSSGNVYVVGNTCPCFLVGANPMCVYESVDGSVCDPVLKKYDSAGTEQWTRPFGTNGKWIVHSLDVDGAIVVVTGNTVTETEQPELPDYGIFWREYDSAGTEQWTRNFSLGSNALGSSTSARGGETLYEIGNTFDKTVNPDGKFFAWVGNYDSAGTERWKREFGALIGDISVDLVSIDGSGNVFVAGEDLGTSPELPADDIYVRKYSSVGTEEWTAHLALGTFGMPLALSVDARGNVYVAGRADGYLFNSQVFVKKYDSAGREQWAWRSGSNNKWSVSSMTVDGDGNVYVVGTADEVPLRYLTPYPGVKLGTHAFVFRLTDIGSQNMPNAGSRIPEQCADGCNGFNYAPTCDAVCRQLPADPSCPVKLAYGTPCNTPSAICGYNSGGCLCTVLGNFDCVVADSRCGLPDPPVNTCPPTSLYCSPPDPTKYRQTVCSCVNGIWECGGFYPYESELN